MHIVTRSRLSEAIEQYPDAASEIKAWVGIVEAVRRHNFLVVSSRFRDADYGNGYVVFDIRRDRYRLITFSITKLIQFTGRLNLNAWVKVTSPKMVKNMTGVE